jgi:hypothetical protein
MVELVSTLSSGILSEERLCSKSILIIFYYFLLSLLRSLKFKMEKFMESIRIKS